MRILIACGLLCVAQLSAAGMQTPRQQQKQIPTGPNIRVLLEKDVNSAFVEARGSYRVVRRDTGTLLSSGKTGKRYTLHALQDGLRWGEEYVDVFQIALIPTSPDTAFYVDGIQYKGALSVYHVRNNKITIVNEVPIEHYLKSTLVLNSDQELHREALSALVITARTEAYTRALTGRSSGRPWEITSKEAGYFGYGVTHQRKPIEEAVELTRFMVLESSQHATPMQNYFLDIAKAEELAQRGYDAKKILQLTFPNQSLGITINADEVAMH